MLTASLSRNTICLGTAYPMSLRRQISMISRSHAALSAPGSGSTYRRTICPLTESGTPTAQHFATPFACPAASSISEGYTGTPLTFKTFFSRCLKNRKPSLST